LFCYLFFLQNPKQFMSIEDEISEMFYD